MIRALVSIEVDLASSLAIRYACRLGNIIPMELHPVYVKSDKAEEPTTGIGWARRTWEREAVQEGREEISELISSEMDSCPAMAQPRVIYGDRDIELQKITEKESFDLYVEGAPYPFTDLTIHKRLHLKLYQRLRCPIVWLRVLRKIDKVLLLCIDPKGTEEMIRSMARLCTGIDVPLYLATLSGSHWAGSPEMMLEDVEAAKQSLISVGLRVSMAGSISINEDALDESVLKDYGMVVVAVERGVRKDSPMLQWLSRIKEPLMIVLV